MTRYAILLLIAAVAGELTTTAQITVNYSSAPGERNVVDSSNTPVPDGNIVAIGYFTTGFDVNANASDYTALQGAWHLFGETTITHIPNVPGGEPGRFAGVATQNDSSFDNKKVYLWITETNNFGTVAEYGLFSSTSTATPDTTWTFLPSSTSPPGNVMNLNSDQVDTFVYGTSVAGSPGSLELAVVAVPEPAGVALLGLGLVMGRFFYRRNR